MYKNKKIYTWFVPPILVGFHLNVIYDMICTANESLMGNIFYQAHQLIAFHIPKICNWFEFNQNYFHIIYVSMVLWVIFFDNKLVIIFFFSKSSSSSVI